MGRGTEFESCPSCPRHTTDGCEDSSHGILLLSIIDDEQMSVFVQT